MSPVSTITVPPPGDYVINTSRSTVELATRHMFGTGKVAATFQVREASLTITDPVTASQLHAVIDAASFASDKPKRDEHVSGPKFLHTEQHPDITVDATSARLQDGAWTVPATVTARGVSAPATLTVQRANTDNDGQLTLVATVRVDRYAHGITAAKGMAGRWMDLTVTAVATPH